jgi:hypothetical protein
MILCIDVIATAERNLKYPKQGDSSHTDEMTVFSITGNQIAANEWDIYKYSMSCTILFLSPGGQETVLISLYMDNFYFFMINIVPNE